MQRYPHDAGKNFPAVSREPGRRFTGNIIPESMIEGRKIRMENIEVFAGSFTARPMMLAMARDAAVKTASPARYSPEFSGIPASNASGAAMQIMALMIHR